MTETMSYKDTIQRVGYTIIDGVKIAQHTCILPTDAPESMRISMTKLDAGLYKQHRDICRADFAAFEDACYQLQDEWISKLDM